MSETHEFREDGSHYNGGKGFFGYGYRAIGEPRLKMVRRWYRQGAQRGKCEDRFFVDGHYVETYSVAQEILKHPPKFTDAEIAALNRITESPADWRKKIDCLVLMCLRDKGAIEWGPRGHCRRTVGGSAALATTPPTDT